MGVPMGTVAEAQDAAVIPPRRGKVLVFTVDSTARPYDIHSLAFGDLAPSADGLTPRTVFLTLAAVGCTVWYQFDSATSSALLDTAAITAGGTPAFADTYGVPLPDGARDPVRITRGTDRFLILKAVSGTSGKLVLWASSDEL